MDEDEKLLRRAEKALSQIKVAQGLSDEHASVLAALRIRLRGDPGKSLEDLLSAAGDLGGPGLEGLLQQKPKSKPSLDEVLGRKRPARRSLDDVLKGESSTDADRSGPADRPSP